MNSHKNGSARIICRVPIILMVVAATAIPVELRPPAHIAPDFHIGVLNAIENVAGYVPVGIVLASLGPLHAVFMAAGISMFVETFQLVMQHRDPSFIDFATNVIGAVLGTVISSRWGICSAVFRVNSRRALIAGILALGFVLGVWHLSGDELNTHGITAPGMLEAYWKLDESDGVVALDSSGHGLHGTFHNEPKRVGGVKGGAVEFDGKRDYIDFGRSTTFRITGSMTISAWINSSSFPVDDAAIVSNHGPLGYQLDTTVDRGPRTIGFKLADACGNLMARYGATPLATGVWYHIAGVYNAEAKTIDVYVNGKLDNGFLAGSVTGRQRSSRDAVYIATRSSSSGFEFAGSIDDVRIYSLALTKEKIAADMRGTATNRLDVQGAAEKPAGIRSSPGPQWGADARCTGSSDRDDARIPGVAVAFGVIVVGSRILSYIYYI
jgi:VanZ family protein